MEVVKVVPCPLRKRLPEPTINNIFFPIDVVLEPLSEQLWHFHVMLWNSQFMLWGADPSNGYAKMRTERARHTLNWECLRTESERYVDVTLIRKIKNGEQLRRGVGVGMLRGKATYQHSHLAT